MTEKKPGLLGIRLFVPRPHRHAAHYERVLGTALEFQCVAENRAAGSRAEALALGEIDRLQCIFNAYQADSELNRWQRTFGEAAPVSPELSEVLRCAAGWIERTEGAFHPAAEALTRIWAEHERTNTAVAEEALDDTLAALRQPSWRVDTACGTAHRLTRLPITLNSIAKGFIIDKAAEAAAHCDDVREVLVNIGGDLRHIGSKATYIEIVDPFATADNAHPAGVVQLQNMGLATSGNYRRGFRIGERWFSHVLNPRTGRPVEHVVSASVIAPDAMTADVLATVFSILTPTESLELADSLHQVGLLLIESGRQRHSNDFWQRHQAPPTQ